MSKRTLAVSFLTAGLTAGVIAGAVGPAAAQGNPVGGSGNVYFLAGAGSTGGKALDVLVFGDPGDEVFYGDWNNDGIDTPMVDRNGVFYVANQDGKTTDVFAYGNPGDKVIVGDWDGKNGDSMAVVRSEQGTNHFFVKNDVKSTGKADSEFFYGDAGDELLVGDWDKDGKDTLMVHRADTSFHVKNDTTTGVADYSFFYGNSGDKVLVGDWANPATYTDGDGQDQIAVRRDGNHYFMSKELGKGKAITALRDVYYGEPTDTVFVASLPSQVGEVGDVKLALDDVTAKYAKADPILVQKPNGDIVASPDKDKFGDPITYAGSEPKVQFKNAPKVYRGTEPVTTADGKPVKYIATSGTPANANELPLPAGGVVPLYNAGDYVLNADGSLKYEDPNTDGIFTPAVQAAPDTRTAAVGDVVLQRRGAPVLHDAGTPAVYEINGQYPANVDVETSQVGDYKLDANGDPIPVAATPGTYEKLNAPIVKVGGFAPGTPVTERRGKAMTVKGSVYTAAATARTFTGTVSNSTRSITVSDGNFTAADIGRDIDGTNIPAAAKIVSVPSATTVTIDIDITVPVTGTVTLPAVTAAWGTAATITDDELRNAYIFDTAPAATYVPKATDKKVSDLDADTKSEPTIYMGTEPVLFVGGDNRVVAPYKGGEAVFTQKKGDVFLDENDEQVQLDADDVWIQGDGLGVRRNFG